MAVAKEVNNERFAGGNISRDTFIAFFETVEVLSKPYMILAHELSDEEPDLSKNCDFFLEFLTDTYFRN